MEIFNLYDQLTRLHGNIVPLMKKMIAFIGMLFMCIPAFAQFDTPYGRGTHAENYVPSGYMCDSKLTVQQATLQSPWSVAAIYTIKQKQISEVVLAKFSSFRLSKFEMDLDAFTGVVGNAQAPVGGLAVTHTWPIAGHLFFETGVAIETIQKQPVDVGGLVSFGYSF